MLLICFGIRQKKGKKKKEDICTKVQYLSSRVAKAPTKSFS